MRRAARVDANQQAIVDRLRSIGVHVEPIGKPVDLLCSWRNQWFIVEVKSKRPTSEGGSHGLTKDQVEFIARSQGPIHVVQSPDEAVHAILGKQHSDPPFHPRAECDCPGDEGSCARLANCRFIAK